MASNSLRRVGHPSSFIFQLLILIVILLSVCVSGGNAAPSGTKVWPLSYEFGDSEQKCSGLELSRRKQKAIKNTMARCKKTFKRNWDVLTVCDWDGIDTVNLTCYLRSDEKNPLRTDYCNECIDGLIEKIWDCKYAQEAWILNAMCKVEYRSSSDGDPSHPTESSRSTRSTASIKTTESTGSLGSTESSKPTEPTEPTDSPNSTEFPKSTELTGSTESTEPTDSPKPTGSTELPSEEDNSSSKPKVFVLVLLILLILLGAGALCTVVIVCALRSKKSRRKSAKGSSRQNEEIQLEQIERSEQKNDVQLAIRPNEPQVERSKNRDEVQLAITLNGPQSEESAEQVQNEENELKQIERSEQRNEVQLDITPNEPATVRNEQRDEVQLAIILNESQTEELAKQNEEIELEQIKRSEEKDIAQLDLTSKRPQAERSKRGPPRLTITLNEHRESALANEFDKNLDDFERGVVLDRNWLKIGERIGGGNFGCVYKGTLEKPGQEICVVAVKKLKNKKQFDTRRELLDEANIMQQLKHENILEMLGICFGEGTEVPMLVLPFMKNGDLLAYIRSTDNSPTVLDLLHFAIDIGRGMAYLSSQRFVHRDLAARNCMLDENLRIKVGDFGLSRDVYERNYYQPSRRCEMPIKWMSIEAIEYEKITTNSDVWSYGVVLWELMTRGQTPYSSLDFLGVYQFVKGGLRLAKPEICPNEIYEIMLDCWRTESNRRPSFDQIVQRIETVTKGNEQYNTLVSREVTYVNYPVKEYYAREGDRQREAERMMVYAALNRTI